MERAGAKSSGLGGLRHNAGVDGFVVVGPTPLVLGLRADGRLADAKGARTRTHLELSHEKPIRSKTFEHEITRQTLRAMKPNLTGAEFERGLKIACSSPMMLMRSYPNAYWHDVSQLPAKRIPGSIGICLGDAHPNNFGFMRLGARTVFSLNDLDDSGRGPVALDAARYFAVLRTMFSDPELTRKAIKKYADVVRHPEEAVSIERELLPAWSKVDQHDLKKPIDHDRLITGDATGLQPIPDQTKAGLRKLLEHTAELEPCRFLDAAFLPRDLGGSAGLKRYRALVERHGEKAILELKEAAEPGINQLGLPDPLSMDERLPILKKKFWGSKDARDDFYAMFENRRFLIRNRLAMSGVDVTKLSKKDRERVVLAQVSVMARLHAEGWQDVKRSEIRDWLGRTSKSVANRWTDLCHELSRDG